MSTYEKGVFINVPFDRKYQRLFNALVFAVYDCGFIARCSLEEGYQVFCSDIGGQDIWPHGNKVEDVIAGVRDWLRTVRKGSAQIPGGRRIVERYLAFRRDLPRMCRTGGLDLREITFLDYRALVAGWLEENEW
jgi:hypothetical protein